MTKISRAPLTDAQVSAVLPELSGWAYDGRGHKLIKSFQFKTFRDALAFIVRLGLEAEGIDHHPEIKNVYNKVDLAMNTHDAGGRVTEMDVELARRIDKLPVPQK